MPSPLDHQRLIDQRDRSIPRDAKPEIVVFTDRKALVKPSQTVEQFSGHHHRGGADQTEAEAGMKDIAGRLSVSFFRVHPDAISHPYFLGLADLDLGVRFHIARLDLEFGWPPQVVGIQKGHIPPRGPGKAQIARGSHSPPGLGDDRQACPVLLKPIESTILGAVVHHDQLKPLKALLKDGLDGL